jgi:two-component system OmpR family sensor kinase
MRLPIRTRLTVVFTGMTLVVLVLAGAALLTGFRAEVDRAIDQGLRSRAAAVKADPLVEIGAISKGDESFAQLIRPDGTIESSLNLSGEPLLPPAVLASIHRGTFFDRDVRTVEERVAARLLAAPVGDGSYLVVGMDVEDRREVVARLTVLVAVGGPIVLVALAILGWILAGAALRPVEELRSEAAAISASEPDRRLPVPDTGDELQRLTETLNGMLDRVHDALDRERHFVDEASHELRTPLGVLKAEVDLALKGPRSGDELEAALRSIAQETERLRRLSQDLLVLARSDRGRLPVHRADVDVSSLIDRVVAEFGDRAGRDLGIGRSGEGRRRPHPAGGREPRRQRPPARGSRRDGRGGCGSRRRPAPGRRDRFRLRVPGRRAPQGLRAVRPGRRRSRGRRGRARPHDRAGGRRGTRRFGDRPERRGGRGRGHARATDLTMTPPTSG